MTEPHASDGGTERSFRRRAATVAAWLVIVVVLVVVGSAVLPRWWSHRVGDQVNGSITAGVALGLFYGFVFTVAPLVALWLTFRKRRTVKTALIMLGVAVVLAGPNLLTLGIVIGSGNAAHAGERTLDVEAPDFRASSLIGAIVGAAALGALGYLVTTRRHSRQREARLREELHAARSPDDGKR